MRKLEGGGYFVYPGSPISITEKERGIRYVNIFEAGKPPTEYSLDTPHFEKINIELDPFDGLNPVELIKEKLVSVHPNASIILAISGFINSEAIKISESELAKQIKENIKGKSVKEDHLIFRDINKILEDDLFKSFMNKLEQTDYDEEKKKQLRELTIKAIMEATV